MVEPDKCLILYVHLAPEPDFESGGRRFEPCRARQRKQEVMEFSSMTSFFLLHSCCTPKQDRPISNDHLLSNQDVRFCTISMLRFEGGLLHASSILPGASPWSTEGCTNWFLPATPSKPESSLATLQMFAQDPAASFPYQKGGLTVLENMTNFAIPLQRISNCGLKN
jgi:hypothetical protein